MGEIDLLRVQSPRGGVFAVQTRRAVFPKLTVNICPRRLNGKEVRAVFRRAVCLTIARRAAFRRTALHTVSLYAGFHMAVKFILQCLCQSGTVQRVRAQYRLGG